MKYLLILLLLSTPAYADQMKIGGRVIDVYTKDQLPEEYEVICNMGYHTKIIPDGDRYVDGSYSATTVNSEYFAVDGDCL